MCGRDGDAEGVKVTIGKPPCRVRRGETPETNTSMRVRSRRMECRLDSGKGIPSPSASAAVSFRIAHTAVSTDQSMERECRKGIRHCRRPDTAGGQQPASPAPAAWRCAHSCRPSWRPAHPRQRRWRSWRQSAHACSNCALLRMARVAP